MSNKKLRIFSSLIALEEKKYGGVPAGSQLLRHGRYDVSPYVSFYSQRYREYFYGILNSSLYYYSSLTLVLTLYHPRLIYGVVTPEQHTCLLAFPFLSRQVNGINLMADPEGFEPSPAGSVPLTDLESAVVAVQLRVYKGLITVQPEPHQTIKILLNTSNRVGISVGSEVEK